MVTRILNETVMVVVVVEAAVVVTAAAPDDDDDDDELRVPEEDCLVDIVVVVRVSNVSGHVVSAVPMALTVAVFRR